MKLFFKFLILIVIAGLIGGYAYWSNHKNKIIKDTIEGAVNKGTDSLYYLHYDSSTVDEINGDAAFYNITLQSDSAQKEMLKRTDDLPNALFNIKIKEIKATGIDVAGLLQTQNVISKKIVINKPVIHIINTGNDKPKTFSADDTLALYKKMLGRFNNIKADEIQITDGSVYITNLAGKALTTMENINVTLNNFLVDSLHNYENIVSYFIKDVKLTVENIQVPHLDNNTSTNIENLDYNAKQRILKVGGVQHYKINDFKPVIDLKNIVLSGLSTNSFILYHQFKADTISCEGGLITVYRKEKVEGERTRSVQLSSDLIDQVQVGSVKLGKTKIVVQDASDPKAEPFVLNDVEFSAFKILKINEGTTVSDLVNYAEWNLRSSGFAMFTKNKQYKLTVSGIDIDNTRSIANVKKITLSPQLSEEAFMKRKVVQGDRYDFVFDNIQLRDIDLSKLFNENKIVIQKASVQPTLKIYNDRTLLYDKRSKVGKYPHQSLAKLNTLLYINQLKVRNGYIAYKERGRLSAYTGTVFFNNINATIDNVTNIEEKIKVNPNCRIITEAFFQGKTKLNTEWRLPLNRRDTSFSIIGQMQPMDATLLNSFTPALGMVSVKKGKINNLKFNFAGGDYSSQGEVVFLYKGLGLEILEKKNNELEVKDVTSFLANIGLKNNNPQRGTTRIGKIAVNRDITKSFFYLLWKSLLDGVMDTAK